MKEVDEDCLVDIFGFRVSFVGCSAVGGRTLGAHSAFLENVMLKWAYSDFRAKTGYHYSNNDLHLR